MSGLFLSNRFHECNETSWEASLSRGDAHIAGMFRFDDFSQSYGPFIFLICATKVPFMSGLFLSNRFHDCNEVSFRCDAHIVGMFRFDNCSHSCGPFIFYTIIML